MLTPEVIEASNNEFDGDISGLRLFLSSRTSLIKVNIKPSSVSRLCQYLPIFYLRYLAK